MVVEISRLTELGRLIKSTHTYFESYSNGLFFMRLVQLNRNGSTDIKDWTQDIYRFYIPVHELEGRTVLPKDRSIKYHKWIRMAIMENRMHKVDDIKSLVV